MKTVSAGGQPFQQDVLAADWAATPLGSMDDWPPELRIAFELITAAGFPMFIGWGPECIFLYNEPYRALLEDRHPRALGKPLKHIWPELWPVVEPLVQKALAGHTSFREDVPRALSRNGYESTAWFTMSYSPIRSSNRDAVGVLCVLSETTTRVLLEQRRSFQLEFVEQLRHVGNEGDVVQMVTGMLSGYFCVAHTLYGTTSGALADVEWLAAQPKVMPNLCGNLNTLFRHLGDEQIKALGAGHTLAVDDVQTDARLTEAARALASAAGIKALLALPCSRERRLRALIVLCHKDSRHWEPHDVELAQGMVERAFNVVTRIHTAKALESSEAALRALNANLEQTVAARTRERDRIWRTSLDLLLEMGSDGVMVAINPAWTRVLGHRPHELLKKSLWAFVHPEDMARIQPAVAQLASGVLNEFEIRLRHKKGSYRWFQWRAAPAEGLIYAMGRDVTTEKHQAEQLLQASEARLSLAVNAGGLAPWDWNLASDAVRWMQGAAALHGLRAAANSATTPANSMQGYLRDHVHPDDRKLVEEAILRSLQGQPNPPVEYRVVWPDQTLHWLEARSRVMLQVDGKPSQMVGICVDITHRKRVEQDLKFLAAASAELANLTDRQEALDRLAFLSVPSFADWCAIDMLGPDGSLERAAVAHVDPAKVQLAHDLNTRFPPDPSANFGVAAVVRTGHAILASRISDQMLAWRITDPEQLAIVKQLGLRSFISAPLRAGGRTLGAVTFIAAESGRLYDTHDLALAEDLARRAALALENADLIGAMRKADKSKDIFLATLSHELRNPLAAMVNGVSLIKLGTAGNEKLARYTAVLDRQTRHLTRLVDDLMDVSRIARGKVELRMETVSLAEMVSRAVEAVESAIQAGRHQLRVDLPAYPTEVNGDPVRLVQVFSNILLNAAKYTHPEGRIEVALQRSGEGFAVRIKDTGIGISAEMMPHLFKMFAQDVHPIERSQGGLGIGLSLAESLVRMHDGLIKAFSEGPGLGSQFTVYLPAAAAVAAAN